MSINTWISDNLIKITGFSNDMIVDCVKALALKAKSQISLEQDLNTLDIDTRKNKVFLNELFDKLAPKKKEPTEYQK